MKKSKSEKRLVTRSIKTRMLITVGVIVCGFCLVVIKLVSVSLIQHNELARVAIQQQLRDTVIAAPRGTIYDANMNELAVSAPCWKVALSPKDLEPEDYEKVADFLAPLLEVDKEIILEKCHENSYYSIVKRKVDRVIIEQIEQFKIDNDIIGINFPVDSKRYYPYGNFLAQVLGFVGDDNQGLSGLESYYESTLSGTPGRSVTAKNAVGSDLYYDYETVYEAIPGNSLVLTIDDVIQFYLEKHLASAVKEHNIGNRACGIVMNVKTGEILGMATKGDFDPNNPFYIYDDEERARLEAITDRDEYLSELEIARQLQWRNKAVADLYEPGSVFKVVTASTALETGACGLNDTFYCGGSFQVIPSVRMNCANGNGHGSETFVQAVINSCNPAFIQIGQRIGAKDFYKYCKAFGLDEKTGIDIPGEAQSDIYDDTMSIVSLASCSFGQSNAITPIQMITAVSAAVNGGYLVQPHVVKQIVDADQNIVQNFDYAPKRQVISKETSELMCEILEQVVMNANGRNAYVAGFRIGGKSGTSQKLTKGNDFYIASFCAIAPADDPEIAVLIMLDEPHSSVSIYGGVLAAPVVAAIMSEVLPYIGVDPVYSGDELERMDIPTPHILDYSLTNAYAALQKVGLRYQIIGDGTTVVDQFPKAGQSIPRGSSVIIYTEEVERRMAVVPDVSNLSLSAARSALQAVGLNIRTSGATSSGSTAIGQSVVAGQSVPVGSVVEVEFISNAIND